MANSDNIAGPSGRPDASGAGTLHLEPGDDGRNRLAIGICLFAACFVILGLRLTALALTPQAIASVGQGAEVALAAIRPDILDRNGEVLATDIRTPSVYADPRSIIDVDDAVERLIEVLPELDPEQLRRDLSSDRAFLFVKREITPRQQAAILQMGIPGVGFVEENRRVYPAGNATSHVLGVVNVDHEGIAGFEKYIDGTGLSALQAAGLSANNTLSPVTITIDLRVQHALHQELGQAMETFRAKAAAGLIMDVHTGEIVAMASLPNYNPYEPAEALEEDRLNRVTSGAFEMGSVFKTFTFAMLLDSGLGSLESTFDVTRPIRVGSSTISDFHGAGRVISMSEAFTKSSNIAAARMAAQVGVEGHQAFLRRLGLLNRLRTELPESAAPILPPNWTNLSTMTISYGHGLSVTPLQSVTALAAMVNGGKYIPPTFIPRSRGAADELAQPVVQTRTSDIMRYLLRLNVENGTGRRANAAGYRVGGKTGTAEKVVDGQYVSNKRRNSFLGAFPMENPKYAFVIMIDEPQSADTGGGVTAGFNAVPTAGRIVERVAPMLGVAPQFINQNPGNQPVLTSF
ncbi:MAG: penicillin-binding protein 2 [Fimbriimonadaceae bacterium]|nr:penicillin-binding protein 2 [Alphaproteobacteria bacterium]